METCRYKQSIVLGLVKENAEQTKQDPLLGSMQAWSLIIYLCRRIVLSVKQLAMVTPLSVQLMFESTGCSALSPWHGSSKRHPACEVDLHGSCCDVQSQSHHPLHPGNQGMSLNLSPQKHHQPMPALPEPLSCALADAAMHRNNTVSAHALA
jgi:hypothetical protein